MVKNKRFLDLIPKNFSKNKFTYFLLPLFLILLGDGIISYVFPVVLGNHISSNFVIGMIMSLSSVIGIACDLLIPIIFPKYGWKFQIIVGIILAITFPITTALGDIFSMIWLFVIAVMLWGIYYEFIMFSQQSFIVEEEKEVTYSHNWSIIEILTDIVEILGPIIGALLLIKGIFAYASSIVAIEALALIFALLLIFINKNTTTVRPKSQIKEYFGVFRELKVWKILSKKVYIILIMSVIVEVVYAGFATFSGIYGEKLINNPDWDWAIMVGATLPYILGSFIVLRLNVRKGKKRLSQIAIVLAGLIMASLVFFDNKLVPILIIVALSNLIMSFCWPLDDAIYSDLQKRLGKKGIHLIGLSQASYSIAYIIAPTFIGLLADNVGFANSFAIIGGISAVLGIILLVVTPRKIRLPHQQLEKV